ncbi:hypothetical protein BC670_0821 [Flavobacterium branchiophilum]|uniref:Uncharacterized protein n=1 Tax=Flavobacterium branchiophilum TaxID=55197 RepID=A0A543G1Q0_9FLAO|nr:hypothetical protein BC670_0821 [Flavobacterium branchiophilum]
MKGLRFFYGYTSHEFHVHPLKINVKQFIKTHNLCQSSDFDKGFFYRSPLFVSARVLVLETQQYPRRIEVGFYAICLLYALISTIIVQIQT